jgi:exocyst complex component 4
MLDGIRQKEVPPYTFEQYETMLSLQCGIDLTQQDTRNSRALDRNYSMYVIELHGLEIENSAS